MKRYDLYGWRTMQLATACELIARALGVQFELHDSDYLGGDYYLSKGVEAYEVSVQDNFEDNEGYLIEPDFPDYRTIVYVSEASQETAQEIARMLADVEGLELLRSELI